MKQDLTVVTSWQSQDTSLNYPLNTMFVQEILVVVAREETDENILEDLLWTDSQEKFLLSESNLNIQSSSSSTTRHFPFHGPVVSNNK